MRRISHLCLVAAMVVTAGSHSWAQTIASGQMPGKAAGQSAGDSPAATTPDTRTEKQKTLATQAEQLCGMAAELKAQVDLTNKNILSLRVVQKAEEIEALARRMKDDAKKHL